MQFAKIKEEQSKRQKKFPADRIAFKATHYYEDILLMSKYMDKLITLEQLCKGVAKNNFLDKHFPDGIPEEMMLNELRLCGYDQMR